MSKQNVREVVLNADRTELLNYRLGLERFVEIFVLADTH